MIVTNREFKIKGFKIDYVGLDFHRKICIPRHKNKIENVRVNAEKNTIIDANHKSRFSLG